MKKTEITQKILAMTVITLLTTSIFSTVVFAEYKKKTNVNVIKIQYLAKTSGDSYYIQFKTCIGSTSVNKPSFSITSDTDSKFVKYEKLHLANTCKNYDATVGAKYPNSISIQMTNETVKK